MESRLFILPSRAENPFRDFPISSTFADSTRFREHGDDFLHGVPGQRNNRTVAGVRTPRRQIHRDTASKPGTLLRARARTAAAGLRALPSCPRRSTRQVTAPVWQATSSHAPVEGQTPPSNNFALALYYQRVGDFNNALVQYRILLEQNDASAEVHNNLGLLHQERGNMDEAVREFRRAIALDPSYVKAHNNLGVAYLCARQLDDAAAELKVALGADARNIESLVNLALVQKAAGRTAEARDLLRRAVSLDPRHAGSHYNLAVVADEGGDMVTAVTHYRAFLRYGAVGYPELAARVRSRLTTLESS